MKKIYALAVAAAAIAIPATVSAQARDYTPHNFTFRGGLVLPIDDELRSGGTTFWGLGVDYDFERSLLPNGTTFLSVDWFARGFDSNVNVFPVNLNHRWMLGEEDEFEGHRTYAFLGIGGTIIDSRPSKVVIGGRAGLGVEFNDNWRAEATFFISDSHSSSGVNGTAVGFYLGYRF